MISVIVPTMWRGKEIVSMLPVLNDHPLVGEIILVDNDPSRKDEATCNLSKVKYVTFGVNIYPVPSWNYGWENAVNDKLLIINDDVVFDPALVDAMYDQISEDVGTITLDPVNVADNSTDKSVPTGAVKEKIVFVDTPDLKYKSAIVLGIHKKVYEKIPEELLIYYNDEFLFRLAIARGKQNKFASGEYACRTKMSSTVNLFGEITRKEAGMYKEIFSKYGI